MMTRDLHAHVDVVDAIWRALRDGVGSVQPNRMSTFVKRFKSAEVVPSYALLDLVEDLGLGDLAHAENLLEAFDIAPVAAFARPGARPRVCIGTRHVTLADAALLLIELERHGLAVDPVPLVAALRPTLARKPLLTGSEMAVWWHHQEQHRSAPVTLFSEDWDGFSASERVRTPTRYVGEAWINGAGRAVRLWVRAPKYRARSAA